MNNKTTPVDVENHPDLTSLNVSELFDETERYVIPIYQRNYAWGATEVEQLIQDIYDAAEQNKNGIQNHKTDTDYFIGSLVVYLRDNGSYETIDGQQRHTTLSILLALMKNIEGHDKKPLLSLDERLSINLHFDSRPKSARTLKDLYQNKTSIEPEEPAIQSAYKIAESYLKKQKINVPLFSKYLFNNVKILRVKVPELTDLNHYFEIMNNRGEQLEKHEVLKARLMAKYKDNVAAQTTFSAIWDACADMQRYVQLGFEKKVRTDIFGEKWSRYPASFDAITTHFIESENNEKGFSLEDIINNRKYSADSNLNHEEVEKEERFGSVIDFSNFLLHVLRVNSSEEVPLDDKRLLDSFIEQDNKFNIEPTVFIMQLLKCRMLFDKYIVKRDNDEKWSLLSLEPYETSFSYINSIGKDEEDNTNNQLIMILSMFHVSYPAMVYKHWLSGALKALVELVETDELNVSGELYLAKLEQLSDDFFFNSYGTDEKKEDQKAKSFHQLIFERNDIKVTKTLNEPLLHLGTSVQNFVFNRLDYLLWKRLVSNYSFENEDSNLDMRYIRERFDTFKFSFRTSVEHYFPQTNPWGKDPMKNVDRFGNLCLITPSSNSKLSNYSPADKKKYYEDKGRSESLKQAFMMSYENWGSDGQGVENIKSHEEMMIKVLCKN